MQCSFGYRLHRPEPFGNKYTAREFLQRAENDISCRIDDKWLILVEHQSSVNPNMAFRCLLYASQLLNNLVTNKDTLYQGELLIFPEPQCFVFYDGDDSEPLTKEIRLSDSFYTSKGLMEFIVTSYNINYDLNQPLLRNCRYLNDYSTLVGKVKQGLKVKLSRREAIIQAINWCIENDVMTGYLTVKRDEVFSMLDLQWNFDEAKVAWFKQGEKKGRENKLLENLRSVMESFNVSVEKAMDVLKIPKEEQPYYTAKLKAMEKIIIRDDY